LEARGSRLLPGVGTGSPALLAPVKILVDDKKFLKEKRLPLEGFDFVLPSFFLVIIYVVSLQLTRIV